MSLLVHSHLPRFIVHIFCNVHVLTDRHNGPTRAQIGRLIRLSVIVGAAKKFQIFDALTEAHGSHPRACIPDKV